MEFKNIDELIKWLDEKCEDVYSFEDIPDDAWKTLESMDFKLVKAHNDADEHRWHTVYEDIYSINFKGETKYIALYSAGSLKSESMSLSDVMHDLSFAEIEAYTTIGYRLKK